MQLYKKEEERARFDHAETEPLGDSGQPVAMLLTEECSLKAGEQPREAEEVPLETAEELVEAVSEGRESSSVL